MCKRTECYCQNLDLMISSTSSFNKYDKPDADCLGNQVYGFGSGKRGQLGVSKDRIRSVSLPQVTIGLDGIEIVGISANGDRSAALSGESTQIFSFFSPWYKSGNRFLDHEFEQSRSSHWHINFTGELVQVYR